MSMLLYLFLVLAGTSIDCMPPMASPALNLTSHVNKTAAKEKLCKVEGHHESRSTVNSGGHRAVMAERLAAMSGTTSPARRKANETEKFRNIVKRDAGGKPELCKKGPVSKEKRLIKELMTRYKEVGVVGRPVCNTLDTVNVEHGISLVQIMELNEREQILTTSVWCTFRWTDILLRWDPEDYDGVVTVRVPNTDIWKPDIVLYNYADQRLTEYRNAMAVVDHNGSVFWMPTAIFKSSCQIDITNFPFDMQQCHMKFGSWTYDGLQLNISFLNDLKSFEMTDYMESQEWKVLGYPAVRNVKYYPCCKEPYPDLTFHLKLQRMGAFYNYILLLPCVLLSTLTLVLFWLPPESPAKMVLGMNIFVAFFLLLSLLAKKTPPAASTVPLIGAYYCLNMILITLSTFLSVIVINLYFRGDRKNHVPYFIKLIMIDGLARMLRMRDDIPPRPAKEQKKRPMAPGDAAAQAKSKNLAGLVTDKSDDGQPPASSIQTDVHEIKMVMSGVIKRFADKDNFGRVQMEWRLVALVCDRLFFFSYLVAIIVSLVTVFPRNHVGVATDDQCTEEFAGCIQ